MTFITSLGRGGFGIEFILRADYSSEKMIIGKTVLYGAQVVAHLPGWTVGLVDEADKTGVISPQLDRAVKKYGRVYGYTLAPFQRGDGIKKDVDYDILKEYREVAERGYLPDYSPEREDNSYTVLYCRTGYDPRWIIKPTEVAYPLFSMSGCNWLIMQK